MDGFMASPEVRYCATSATLTKHQYVVSRILKLAFFDKKKEPIGSFLKYCRTNSANKLGRQHNDAFTLHSEFSFQLAVTCCQGALVNGIGQFLSA